MTGWRGIVSLLLTWLVVSGAGCIVLGYILAVPALRAVGYSIYTFWLLPMTPMIPICIGIALIVQRFIFQDKNVSIANIKKQFKKSVDKDIKQ